MQGRSYCGLDVSVAQSGRDGQAGLGQQWEVEREVEREVAVKVEGRRPGQVEVTAQRQMLGEKEKRDAEANANADALEAVPRLGLKRNKMQRKPNNCGCPVRQDNLKCVEGATTGWRCMLLQAAFSCHSPVPSTSTTSHPPASTANSPTHPRPRLFHQPRSSLCHRSRLPLAAHGRCVVFIASLTAQLAFYVDRVLPLLQSPPLPIAIVCLLACRLPAPWSRSTCQRAASLQHSPIWLICCP